MLLIISSPGHIEVGAPPPEEIVQYAHSMYHPLDSLGVVVHTFHQYSEALPQNAEGILYHSSRSGKAVVEQSLPRRQVTATKWPEDIRIKTKGLVCDEKEGNNISSWCYTAGSWYAQRVVRLHHESVKLCGRPYTPICVMALCSNLYI